MTNVKKFDADLFDLADEMTAEQIAKSGSNGYMGHNHDNEDPNGMVWRFFGGLSDERYGGSCYDFFGCEKADSRGRILRKFKEVKDRETGKVSKVPDVSYMHNVEKDEKFLFVRMGHDIVYDKHGNPKTTGRGENKSYVYDWTGPGGTPGGTEKRNAKRAAVQAEKDRVARWEARGILYSPWGDHWKVKDTHPEFYEILREHLNANFERKPGPSHDDVVKAADLMGVDRDELAQYLSEQRSSLAEAFRNSYLSNN